MKYGIKIHGYNSADWWDANGTASFSKDVLSIEFIYEGYRYKIVLRPVAEGKYQGVIFESQEEVGRAYFSRYDKKNDLVLVGSYVEAGEDFDCFIELRSV